MARVLVVEDDVSLALLLTYLLSHEGHDVEVVHDGDSAIARLDEDPTDAVLVDVMLPSKASGLDVLRELRQRPGWEDVPAIVVSALSSDKHQWEGWAAGASSYVAKPYNSEHLLGELRDVLAATDGEPSNPRD